MDRVSDEQLNVLIGFAADDVAEAPGPVNHVRWLALVELRERRLLDIDLIAAVNELSATIKDAATGRKSLDRPGVK
jgi:hypothetical protein